jgi:hypothetical protein
VFTAPGKANKPISFAPCPTSGAQPRLETLFPVDMRATVRVPTYRQIHPDFAHVLAARTPAIDLDVDHQV